MRIERKEPQQNRFIVIIEKHTKKPKPDKLIAARGKGLETPSDGSANGSTNVQLALLLAAFVWGQLRASLDGVEVS